MDLLLGLDLGTTNIKGAAYDLAGTLLALTSRPTPTVTQGPRQAHHDPEALWAETVAVLRELVSRAPSSGRILGLAIASIGEAGVPLDAQGQPLYPIIAWYDERTAPQAAWWAQEVGAEAIYRLTGLPLGHTFTLNKLLWLRAAEPEVYARMRRWLCVSDYLAYRLTGEGCMGYSLASRTMALDLRRRCWSAEMLSWAGVEPALLPELRPEGSLVGTVTPEAARATGLLQGTPVYVGGHDHVCGALASGVFEPGIVLDSTGTTEAELTTMTEIGERLEAAEMSFCLGCHVLPERYYVIGSVLGAGSTLQWLAELLWPEAPQDREGALRRLTEEAASSPLGARGLYLLPHLAGAGSPQRDATARGVWVGLSVGHGRADLARAAMEGLAFELRLLWEALERFTGHPLDRVIVVGGGARNRFWTQIKADVTGRPLFLPQQSEAVTLGAALLAGLGAGVYAGPEELPHLLRRGHVTCVVPQRESRQRYDRRYRLLMDRVRPLAAQLSHLGPLLDRDDAQPDDASA
jgi:xylulokinase